MWPRRAAAVIGVLRRAGVLIVIGNTDRVEHRCKVVAPSGAVRRVAVAGCRSDRYDRIIDRLSADRCAADRAACCGYVRHHVGVVVDNDLLCRVRPGADVAERRIVYHGFRFDGNNLDLNSSRVADRLLLQFHVEDIGVGDGVRYRIVSALRE